MNAVCPGTVETPSWHVSFHDDDVLNRDDDDDNDDDDSGADDYHPAPTRLCLRFCLKR